MYGKLLSLAIGLLAAFTAIGYAQTSRDYGYGRQGDRDECVGLPCGSRPGDRNEMRSEDRDRMGRQERERRDRDGRAEKY